MDTFSSSASTLRTDSAEKGRKSFAFFTRALLGLRQHSAARLAAIQSGEAILSKSEKRLWLKWLDFRAGASLPETAWLAGAAADSRESVAA